jgi:3-methyl-2-oxobutanoate hydroxymethyltransferase
MSHIKPVRRLTAPAIRARKGQSKVVALTAYNALMAGVLDEHVDVLLVGDSLGMVLYGFDSTVPVTLDTMIFHASAVVRGSKRALVVVDLPFGTYEASKEQAFETSVRVLKESGAAAVKLEGGVSMAPIIAFLTARGVPVLAHIGLTPQAIHQLGSYKPRGQNDSEAAALLDDAHAVAAAGAFAVVIENVPHALGQQITQALEIPTIGIGAGDGCDGQVLVSEDMLGFSAYVPPFVTKTADVRSVLEAGVRAYAERVRG